MANPLAYRPYLFANISVDRFDWHAADHLSGRDVAVYQGGSSDQGLGPNGTPGQYDGSRPYEASPQNCDPGCVRGKASHQGMVLLAYAKMCQHDRARRQRDVILKYHRRSKIEQHFITNEAFRANPQRTEAAPVDIDHCEAMQNRVGTDCRTT